MSAPVAAPHDVLRTLAAAYRARLVYPGPVGELIERELTAAAQLGKTFGYADLVGRLVAHIIATPRAEVTP